MVERVTGWIQTYTGKQFFPIEPHPEEVDINDIAHALSMMCRFAGHVDRFYSVAQHSVLLSRYAPDEFKLWALLHDATEAYLVDVPRPVKPYLTNYVEIETNLMSVIATKFNLGSAIIPPEVKAIDVRILLDEQSQLMKPQVVPWVEIPGGPLNIRINHWGPERAKEEFLDDFHKLTNGAYL